MENQETKIYAVPAEIMNAVLQVVHSLPYRQVAPLAQALEKLVKEQNEFPSSYSTGAPSDEA